MAIMGELNTQRIGENKMPTRGEERFMAVVQSSLREIAKQLTRANRIAALKLRAQIDETMLCKDAIAELSKIMED